MKKIITVVLLLCAMGFAAKAQTTKGNEFWFTYMENLNLSFNGPPDFSVVISSEVNTSGQIEFPATGLTIPFTVAAMQATEVYLPPGILYPQGDENIFNYGLKVVANDSVNVYAYHHRVYFSEATLVVPASELTWHYMISAQIDEGGTSGNSSPGEMVIEATADSTVIEIVPSVITYSFRPPGVPFYITLNKGQVFQLQSYFNLSGTTITSLDSTKKVAVFSGARQSHLRCTGADDHLYDMNYMNMYGLEFVVVPMLGQGGDPVIILNLEDSNFVRINNGLPIFLASKGMHIDTFFTAASYVVSEKPVGVALYNKSQLCNTSQLGDPCMVIIPPVNLLKYRALFLSNDGIQGNATPNHFINIVVNASGGVPASLDGIPMSGFQTFSYNPQYMFKQVTTTSGVHNLYAPNGFNAYAYGLGSFNAYAFHLGYDYKLTPTGINELEGAINTTILPNPFSCKATVTLLWNRPLSDSVIEIFSADGKRVLVKTFDGNTTDIERKNIAAGIYFYVVKNLGVEIAKGKIAVE